MNGSNTHLVEANGMKKEIGIIVKFKETPGNRK